MNRFTVSAGAMLLGFALVNSATAHEPSRRPGIPHSPPVRIVSPQRIVQTPRIAAVATRAYYLDHGVRYSGGYYYQGNSHRHWEYKVWNARYNRYHYWDPYLNCYYYYSPTQCGYYPIN